MKWCLLDAFACATTTEIVRPHSVQAVALSVIDIWTPPGRPGLFGESGVGCRSSAPTLALLRSRFRAYLRKQVCHKWVQRRTNIGAFMPTKARGRYKTKSFHKSNVINCNYGGCYPDVDVVVIWPLFNDDIVLESRQRGQRE